MSAETVQVVDPRSSSLWSDLLRRQPACAFVAPAWIQVLVETYGFDVEAAVVVVDGAPVAGVPIAHVHDVFGDRLVVLPFSDFTDPVAVEPAHWAALSSHLRAGGRPVQMRCRANPHPLADPGFRLVDRARWHGIDVRPGAESLWHGFDQASRRAIRKAERGGVSVELRTDRPAVRTFYELHLAVRKHKYSMLAQPFAFFESIWRHWIEPGDGALLVASSEGEPIAATLLLRWQDTLYYKFNASARARLDVRPNDLLIWRMIQHAGESGCSWIDFGLTDWDQDGLARFKRKFASHEEVISFIRHTPAGVNGSPEGARMRGALESLARLLAHPAVPDAITEEAGTALYRFFV